MSIRIIKCGPIYFFTTPFPPGSVMQLIPPEVDRDSFNAFYCGERYFAITVSPPLETKKEPESAFTQSVLKHIWSELIRRGITEGQMPEPVIGDPFLMLSSA